MIRWKVIDPMTISTSSVSPFAYCGNNPVNFIDPSGMTRIPYEMTMRLYEVDAMMHSVGPGGGGVPVAGSFYQNSLQWDYAHGFFHDGSDQPVYEKSTQTYWVNGHEVSYDEVANWEVRHNNFMTPDEARKWWDGMCQRDNLNQSISGPTAGGPKLSLGQLKTAANVSDAHDCIYDAYIMLEHYMVSNGRTLNFWKNCYDLLIYELMLKNALNFSNSFQVEGWDGCYVGFDAKGTDFNNSIGHGYIYFDEFGHLRGFSDWINFESQPDGYRTGFNELKTTIGSFLSGTPYWIIYGNVPPEHLRPKH